MRVRVLQDTLEKELLEEYLVGILVLGTMCVHDGELTFNKVASSKALSHVGKS